MSSRHLARKLASDRGIGLALAAAFIASRLWGMQLYIDSLDATNFALALKEYDLARYQPHFPGYPVYIALARVAHTLGASVPGALCLPALLTGLPALLLLYVACRRLLPRERACLVVTLWLVCPGLWLASEQPASDSLGLALFTAGIAGWFLARTLPGARGSSGLVGAGLCLGLALGVRLSYWPLLLVFLLALIWTSVQGRSEARAGNLPRQTLPMLAGLGIGVLAWLLPLCWITGLVELARLGRGFVAGHFSSWGGALSVHEAPGLWERSRLLGWNIFPYSLGAGFGLGIVGIAILALIALALGNVLLQAQRQNPSVRKVLYFAVSLGLPYLIWIMVAQNPEKPRHVLPLVSLLLVVVGIGFPGPGAATRFRRRLGRAGAVALAAGMAWVGATRVATARTTPSASLQLVEYVASEFEPEGLMVYGGEEVRLPGRDQYPGRSRASLPDVSSSRGRHVGLLF